MNESYEDWSCPCMDPENCTEVIPGYLCRKGAARSQISPEQARRAIALAEHYRSSFQRLVATRAWGFDADYHRKFIEENWGQLFGDAPTLSKEVVLELAKTALTHLEVALAEVEDAKAKLYRFEELADDLEKHPTTGAAKQAFLTAAKYIRRNFHGQKYEPPK